MIIPINEKYRIKSGRYSWDVQFYKEWTDSKTDELHKEWHALTYHNTLSQALRSSERREIRMVEGTLGPEVIAAVEALHHQYRNIMEGLDYDKYFEDDEKIAERRRK